jgi:hypothetical protein
MNRIVRTVILTVGVLCFICLAAPAYKYSEFTDLDSLMEKSKFIVLARIATFGQDKDENGPLYHDGLVRYEVIVVHNVRGSLPLDRHSVILQSSFIRKYHNFSPGGMALLFLTDENSIGGEKILMNWSNSGSIMPASPDIDLSKLKGLSEKEQILYILKDYARFKERELKELKADIAKIE